MSSRFDDISENDRFRYAGLSKDASGFWVDAHGCAAAPAPTDGAFVGWLDVSWPQTHEPIPHLQSVEHVADVDDLEHALKRARRRRQRALRTCRLCQRRLIPGHMHSNDECQSCAERHLGVVH